MSAERGSGEQEGSPPSDLDSPPFHKVDSAPVIRARSLQIHFLSHHLSMPAGGTPQSSWSQQHGGRSYPIRYVTVTVAVTVTSPGWTGVDAMPPAESLLA